MRHGFLTLTLCAPLVLAAPIPSAADLALRLAATTSEGLGAGVMVAQAPSIRKQSSAPAPAPVPVAAPPAAVDTTLPEDVIPKPIPEATPGSTRTDTETIPTPPAAAPTSSPVTSSAIDLLLGPIARIGTSSDPLITAYDDMHVRYGRLYADAFVPNAATILSENYYDRALAFYRLYHRTGDPYWRDRARLVATTWRSAVNNQSIPRFLAGEYSLGPIMPPGRSMSTLGLAILAVEAGDAEARRVVSLHANLVETGLEAPGMWGLGNTVMPLGDSREAGYSLMALMAATALGDDRRQSARRLVDAILARQRPDGQWQSWAEAMGSTTFTLNYMNGLLMEGLILYDRVVGDPRVLPAIQRALNWTWQTQWLPWAQCFQYGNINAGSIDTNPAHVLNGLMIPAWGYVYAKTGDVTARDRGRAILRGMVDSAHGAILNSVQFTQSFRSSDAFVGFQQSR